MFELIFHVLIFFGVAAFMWSVSNSLQQIAKDLGIIAAHASSKPLAEDPEQLIGA